MLSLYPPTTEVKPNLVTHRHRLVHPDIVKTPRLTVVRICLRQGRAASSSATTRNRPVMTESATKDTRACRTMTLRVRQATATSVMHRRRVIARRLTHRHLCLHCHPAATMEEEA